MGQHETPPASPVMEEVVEEIDDDELESIHGEDVEIVDSYQVEETEDDEAAQMAGEEEEEVVEAMEREDACCIFDKHLASVFCGSLSKDNQFAVTGGEDDKAYIWNVTNGEVLLEITGHKDSVIFADFSYDNKYLATGDMSGIIQVRETAQPNIVIWNYNMGDATWMQWHPMAHILLGGAVEGEVYMWKVPEGECKIVQGYGKRAESASLMLDGKRLVVGYEDGAIRVVDLKSCIVTHTITSNQGHHMAITALDCHLDNNIILSAAVDGKTIVSAANSGKIIEVLQDLCGSNENNMETSSTENTQGNWVEAIAFLKDPSQHTAATGTVNGEIYIWDVAKKVIKHIMDQGSGVAKLLWKENTSLLFSAGLDGILRVYDSRTSELKRTFLGHTEDILDLSLSKNGKLALTTSDDTSARIFAIESI